MGAWFSLAGEVQRHYQLGTTADEVRQLFYEQETALQKAPRQGRRRPGEWDDAFLFAGYAQSTWPGLGHGLRHWVHHHDATQLVAAYEDTDTPGNDNGFAVYSAVQLHRRHLAAARGARGQQDAWRLNRVAPFLDLGRTPGTTRRA